MKGFEWAHVCPGRIALEGAKTALHLGARHRRPLAARGHAKAATHSVGATALPVEPLDGGVIAVLSTREAWEGEVDAAHSHALAKHLG